MLPPLNCDYTVRNRESGAEIIDFSTGAVQYPSPVDARFFHVTSNVYVGSEDNNGHCQIYALDGRLLRQFSHSAFPLMQSSYGILCQGEKNNEDNLALYDNEMSETPIFVWPLVLGFGYDLRALPHEELVLVKLRDNSYTILNLKTGAHHALDPSLKLTDIAVHDQGIVGVNDKQIFKFDFTGELIESIPLPADGGGSVYVKGEVLYFCKTAPRDYFSGEKPKVNISAYDFATMARIGWLQLPKASCAGDWANFDGELAIKLSCWGDNDIVEHCWLLTLSNDDWVNGTATPEFESWHIDFQQQMIAKNRSEYVVTPPNDLSFATLLRQIDVASWKVCGVAAKTSGKDNWDKTFTGKIIWDLSALDLTEEQCQLLTHTAEKTAESLRSEVYAPVKRAEITIECCFEADENAAADSPAVAAEKPLLERVCDLRAMPTLKRVPSNRKGNITFDLLTDEGGLEDRIEDLMALAGDALDFTDLEIVYADNEESQDLIRFETRKHQHQWRIDLDPYTVSDNLLAAIQQLIAEETKGELVVGNAPDGWIRAAYNATKK
ncbi:hypothetical protein EZV61_06555 [Corallincola luteus]|uniref:Uncharacterized protein n=1 Tax=Corallincola luteus TaxID=1775177 RepID=A0ABY2ATI5_9GAMM|nr:hypothetical protein [Corallincola luteus]TCI05587.1 hypothetical protein EZV61_06555 [Corallincola luteus]